jgi:glycosyltransferase involved in cell wall biosynthesis
MKKIAVFAPVGTIDHQTGIINAINSFAKNDYVVDVFTVRNTYYPEPRFDFQNIKVYYMPFSYKSRHESRILVTILFLLWIVAAHSRDLYPLVFAGGVRGLFAAYIYSLFHPTVEIINYQTELYLNSGYSSRTELLFKSIERRAAKRSFITIEHDDQRRELLCNDLGLDKDSVLVIPNSPCGPGQQLSSRYLHEQLGISQECKILLAPGSVSEYFESSKVVEISQSLHDPWRCVLHSVQPRTLNEPYIKKLIELNSKEKVIFSLTPVPYSEINNILASAEIGLILYSSELGENISNVGLSSGKLSHFLKLGVPVIVSNLPGLSDFVQEHKIGEVLVRQEDLPILIEKISVDIIEYRKRCVICFNTYLAYESAFAKVIDSIRVMSEG